MVVQSSLMESANADLGLYQLVDEAGVFVGSGELPAGEDLLLDMYRQMRRLRILEARMVGLQRQGRVGFYGTCTGQEAPPVATACATDPGDWVFPALRESAIMLARGFPLSTYLAQVFGNSLDVLKGRQMPSHMSGRSVNQVSWGSCIGPQVPQAVGAAWAAKLRGDRTVTIGFLGDGATSQPDFHNAMNFAGVYRVPCVLICQNNGWSISVPTERQTASETIAVKARAYGLPAIRVDGNDVVACFAAIRDAVTRARSGEGATFVECVTYRIGAHSTSDDPTRYRSEEEVKAWAKKDPVERLQKLLRSRGALSEDREAAIDSELTDEISTAIKTAEHAPLPPRESLFDDVYAARPWHLEEQLGELLRQGKPPSH